MSAADDTTTVTVAHGWAVFIDGRHHVGGERLKVDQATADHWINRGWAESTPKVTRTRRRADSGR